MYMDLHFGHIIMFILTYCKQCALSVTFLYYRLLFSFSLSISLSVLLFLSYNEARLSVMSSNFALFLERYNLQFFAAPENKMSMKYAITLYILKEHKNVV